MTNMSMANPMLAAALALAVATTATAAAAREQDPVSTSYLIDETARGRDFLVSEGSPCVFSAQGPGHFVLVPPLYTCCLC